METEVGHDGGVFCPNAPMGFSLRDRGRSRYLRFSVISLKMMGLVALRIALLVRSGVQVVGNVG